MLGLDANPADAAPGRRERATRPGRCGRRRTRSGSASSTPAKATSSWTPRSATAVQFRQLQRGRRRRSAVASGAVRRDLLPQPADVPDPGARPPLVRRMTGALAPGGYLFLGHTDSLGSRPDGLEPQHTHHTFYYRRPSSPRRSPRVRLAGARRRTRPVAGALPPARRSPTSTTGRCGCCCRTNVSPRRCGSSRPSRDGPARARATCCCTGCCWPRPAASTTPRSLCRRLLDADGLYADAHHLLGVCLEGGAAVDVAIGHYRLAALPRSGRSPCPGCGSACSPAAAATTATPAPELDRALTPAAPGTRRADRAVRRRLRPDRADRALPRRTRRLRGAPMSRQPT